MSQKNSQDRKRIHERSTVHQTVSNVKPLGSQMKKTIGWQKYEDIIEQNISSPLMNSIMEKFNTIIDPSEKEDTNSWESVTSKKRKNIKHHGMVPISQQLIEDISMLNNFECWMGHTNFDITPEIRDRLDKIKGIELLKICSRYRFFIGIGKMFVFSGCETRKLKILFYKQEF